jgi:hypothetical protein
MNELEKLFGVMFRAAVVLFFAVGGAFGPPDRENMPSSMLLFLAAVCYVSSVLGGFVLLILSRRRDRRDWSRPTWFTSPLSGPSHFLHMGGWAFVAFGLAFLIPTLVHGGEYISGAIALSFGSGLLTGMQLYYMTRSKHGPAT